MTTFDLKRLLGPEARRSPDMEAVWSWIVSQDRDLPNWMTLPPAEARALHDGLTARWNAELPEVAQVEAVTVPGSPAVQCQLIVPPEAVPGCILFLHGGGWAFGNLATHQRFMRLLAVATRRRVLGADYRLAPEHPFPAPFEDGRTAWRWLATAGATDARFAGPLALAGDSAGANLAMAIMLDAATAGAAQPDLALLFYGAYNGGGATPSTERFKEGFGLTRAAMAQFWALYVPDPGDRPNPLVSAVNAPLDALARLPPLFLNAAGLDPLLCDTLDLGARLAQAGTTHEVVVHDGVHHGFMQMSLRLPEAQRAIEAAAAFVERHIGSRRPAAR